MPRFPGVNSGPESRRYPMNLFAWLPRLSGWDAGCCNVPITPEKLMEVMADCGGSKAPGLDCLFYELYNIIPDLFEHLLASVYIY